GDGEGGHHPEDVPEGVAESLRSLPCISFQNQYGRQEQGQQKKDMVEADPDVPDALAQVIEKLPERRGFARAERERRPLGGEHCGLRGAAALEAQQAAVRRIDVEEQAVGDLHRSRRASPAVGVEAQHCVSAVAVLVHQQIRGSERTGLSVRKELESGKRIRLDPLAPGLELAPGDLAVAVGVQADRELEVAQRDVPLAAQRRALDAHRQVAVARFVSVRSPRDEQEKYEKNLHFRRAASARNFSLSNSLDSSHASAGAAATGSRAASAASMRIWASRGSRWLR